MIPGAVPASRDEVVAGESVTGAAALESKVRVRVRVRVRAKVRVRERSQPKQRLG